jgi:signal transduction histidine kinase
MVAMTKALQEHQQSVKASFEKFTSDVVEKVNGLARLVGQQQAQLGVLAGAGEGIDRNVLAMAEMMKEVFGQLTMIDEMLKVMDFKKDDKSLEELVDDDVVRKTALEWYQSTVASSFETVNTKMAEHRAAQAAAKEQQAAAPPAEAELSEEDRERERIAKEFQEPGSAIATPAPAPEQPHIPEGAQIFGG